MNVSHFVCKTMCSIKKIFVLVLLEIKDKQKLFIFHTQGSISKTRATRKEDIHHPTTGQETDSFDKSASSLLTSVGDRRRHRINSASTIRSNRR